MAVGEQGRGGFCGLFGIVEGAFACVCGLSICSQGRGARTFRAGSANGGAA
jgi:hypothetical protein